MAAKLGLKQKSGQTVEKIQKPVSEPSLFDFSEETDLPVQEDIGASIADVRVLSDAASVRSFVGSVCASGGNVGFSLNAVGAEAMTARGFGGLELPQKKSFIFLSRRCRFYVRK